MVFLEELTPIRLSEFNNTAMSSHLVQSTRSFLQDRNLNEEYDFCNWNCLPKVIKPAIILHV